MIGSNQHDIGINIIGRNLASAPIAEAAQSAKLAQQQVARANEETAATAEAAAAKTQLFSNKVGMIATGVAAAVAISAGSMVKAAGDYQSSITRLATSAGESKANLDLVSKGVLDVANSTGTSTKQLTAAMYTIESGGQHGAAGLAVLKAAAQGAKTENADLAIVADAVTSAMTDYHYSADKAADVTSKLVAATGQGKTTFQELAGAMPAILPIASAAHIALNDILGDMASMTMHGMSAQQSAENLADAIRHMQSPTQQQSKELAALGLNATELSQKLGERGLSGTIQTIATAIQQRLGKDGTQVILNMQDALKGLPESVKKVAQEVINGTASYAEYTKATKGLTETQHAQAQSFATLWNGMHTIGTEQMSGAQVMQTYAGAMNKAMGDASGLNVALMLTGENTGNTTKAIAAVSKATADAQGNVAGWGEIQGTFNQKLSVFKEQVGTTGIAIGLALLPPLTKALDGVTKLLQPVDNFIRDNKDLAAGLLITAGGLSTLVALTWAAQKATSALSDTWSFASGIGKKFAGTVGLLNTEEAVQSGVGELSAAKGIGGAARVAGGGASLARDAGALSAAAGAAEATGSVTALSGAFGTLAAVLTGPVGLALAGTAVAVGVAALAVKKHTDSVNAQRDALLKLKDSQEVEKRATTDLTAAHQLQTSASAAATKAAKDHKTATDQVTKASKDLDKAQRDVKTAIQNEQDALKKYGENSPQYQKAVNDLANAEQNYKRRLDELKGSQDAAKAASDRLKEAHKEEQTAALDVSTASDKMAQAAHRLHDAQSQLHDKQEELRTAQLNYKTALQLTGPQSDQTRDAALRLRDAENEERDAAARVKSAQDGVTSAVKNTASAFDRAHDAIKTYNSVPPSQWKTQKLADGSTFSSATFASGTNFAPGGLSLVGETGPELIDLPTGSKVYTAKETKQMMQGGGGDTNITISGNITITTADAANAFWDRIDKTQRLARLGMAA